MTVLPVATGDGRLRDAALLPLVGIAQAVLFGLGVFATRTVFDALHAGTPVPVASLATIGCTGALVAGLELVSRIRAEAFGQSYASALRLCLYQHLAGLSRSAIAERRLGGLSLRFVGDLSAARNWFGRGLPRLVSAAVVLPGAAVVLWLLDPRIALAGGLPLAIALAFGVMAALGLEARHRALRTRRAGIAIGIIERIALTPELDLFGRTGREGRALSEDGVDLRRGAMEREARIGLLRFIVGVGAVAAGVAILWTTAAEDISAGTAAAALSMVALLALPLGDAAGAWDRFCAWRIAREKLAAVLAMPSERRAIAARGQPVAVTARGRLAGRAVDLAIEPGACVALTGPGGSGKSLLARALAGLDREAGLQIAYDGQSAPLPRILYIGPAPIVLRGSLRRNLTLGLDARPGDRRLARRLAEFGLARVVQRLGGLDGRIAEGAANLSSGESLRLELVRAGLAAPDLLVMDTDRLAADPEAAELVARLRAQLSATLVFTWRAAIAPPSDVRIALDEAAVCLE